jgi:nitroimidazol reductase NimA-like FMN-containing flavoprotein (pyridoxamine 5'-phosphate oxidase superfamily)
MSDEEVDGFLGLPLTMALATISSGGQPHLAAMWYGFVDGALGFLTYRGSQKCKNIERDPRVTCMFEDGSRSYEQLRGVVLTGRVVQVSGEQMERLAFDITERSQGPLDDAGREGVRRGLRKRLGFVLEVTHTASWDHAKQAGAEGAAKGAGT